MSSPSSPLVYKQRRFTQHQDAASSIHETAGGPSLSTDNIPLFVDIESKTAALDELYSMDNIPAMTGLPFKIAPSSNIQQLELESYAVQTQYAQESQRDKQTGGIYKRYLNNYIVFWGHNQAERKQADPLWESVNWYPITATKVTIFLKHEMQREKKKRGTQDTIAHSTVGKSVISGTITALEFFRFQNQHQFKSDVEAQTQLRQDSRIRQLEDAAKHKEPERVGKSLALKAAGTSCDTYKVEELVTMANWCLTNPSGPVSLTIHVRDRAMLLVSTVLAFRGDSARQLLWSDLFRRESINHAKGIDSVLPMLGVLADNAKHNQNGRIDELGALRHRRVDLCAVGALAILFFAHWHVDNNPVPDFAPDMSQGGESGTREWYNLHVFHASDPLKPMSYDNHLERIKRMHSANDVSTYKATHAGRVFFAQNARKNGASTDDTKALGGWNENGAFRPCYDRELPLPALLAAAAFNGTKPEAHFLPRENLNPPEHLACLIFPWIEGELEALIKRQHANKNAKDIALREFLTLLRWLRTILVQDLAVLAHLVPSSPLFKYAPFNTDEFRKFSGAAMVTIEACEREARAAFQSLPSQLVEGLRGALAQQELMKQESDRAINVKFEMLQAQMSEVIGMVGMAMVGNGKSRQRARKAGSSGSGFEGPPPPIPFHPSVLSQPLVSSPAVPNITINIKSSCGTASATVSASPDSPPITPSVSTGSDSTLGFFPRSPLSTLTPAVSQNLPNAAAGSVTPEDTIPVEDVPTSKWNMLVTKYGASKVQTHRWDWVETGWLPRYDFQRAMTIADVWKEHAEGLNGFLSVRELQEGWGASWMRNEGKRKTECCRRKKIVSIIGELTSKRRWSTQLALRFLSEQYQMKFKSARLFSDWLTKDKGANRLVVLHEAESYP